MIEISENEWFYRLVELLIEHTLQPYESFSQAVTQTVWLEKSVNTFLKCGGTQFYAHNSTNGSSTEERCWSYSWRASDTPAQIVTDQQTGQKIQIVTAVDPASVPKQQFILAAHDGTATSKVILASPSSPSTKQLIFTTADNLVPGRIQVHTQTHSV